MNKLSQNTVHPRTEKNPAHRLYRVGFPLCVTVVQVGYYMFRLQPCRLWGISSCLLGATLAENHITKTPHPVLVLG